jgi:heme-degrading monooxygenase HmoA
MYARVSTFEGPVGRLDEFVAQADSTITQLRDLPGFLGVDVLVNRQTGKILTITLWDSKENVEVTTAAAARLRARGLQPERGDRQPTYEVFEHVVSFDNRASQREAA